MVVTEKLFSSIYVFGTTLAIASATVFAILIWTEVGPVYPEYQRGRTYYLGTVFIQGREPNRYISIHPLSYDMVKNNIYQMKNADVISAEYSAWDPFYAKSEVGPDVEVDMLLTDPAFFDIYSYKFLAGKPFTKADFDSGVATVVIGDKTAEKIFGPVRAADLAGRNVVINHREYRISGVVREPGAGATHTHAGVIAPYTSDPASLTGGNNFSVKFLSDDQDALQGELAEIVARYNNSQDKEEMDMYKQPVSHYAQTFTYVQDTEFSLMSYAGQMLLILLVLLLVPAMNLSGMISGRMEGRVVEIGVRKSFGATRGRLLRQILWENLILTVAGGVLGYVFAVAMLGMGIGSLFARSSASFANGSMSGETLLSPVIFLFAFLVCCLLNLMSAMIPAARSLRHPIVESLK